MGNKALDTDRRDVRLQIFVTPGMDDKILDIAELMGMNKNEVCRMAIGQLALSYQTKKKSRFCSQANAEQKRTFFIN